MKTHFKKLRNPNYLGSWDFVDNDGNYFESVLKIASVKKEMVHDGNGGQSECAVIYFEKTKPMVANATNLKAVSKAIGSSYIEDWSGKDVVISVKKVKAFGETHDALRISPKPPQPKEKPELTPTHPKWEGAKNALKQGTTTIESIKSVYRLSQENEEKLKP